MAFVTIGTKKVYGPLSIDDEFTVERLTRAQIKYIYENFLRSSCTHDQRQSMGYLGRVNVHETMSACFLSRGRRLPRPVDISRLLAQVRSLDEVLPV